MGKRFKQNTALMIRQHTIMKTLWKEMSSGVLIKIKGCHVHLSIVFDEETRELSAHITDELKKKHYFIAKKNVDEMVEIVEHYLKSSIRRYTPESKYRQFHPSLQKAMGFGQDPNRKVYDFGQTITAMVKGTRFKKCLVRDGLKHKIPRAGFILKNGEYFLVVPFDKRYAWVQSFDIEKSPLWELPIMRGIVAYFAYLDKYQILEKSEMLSRKNKKLIRGAFLSVLADAER